MSRPDGPRSDTRVYWFGVGLGLCAGFIDAKFADLLLTALFVLASTMLLGALRPERPLEVDGCRRHIRSSGAVGRLFIADSEAIPGSNLRIFPGISHWHRGRLRRRAGAESVRGVVRGEVV